MTLITISLAAMLSRATSIGALSHPSLPEIPQSDRFVAPRPVVVMVTVLRPPPPKPDSDPSYVGLVGVDSEGLPLDGAHRYVVHFRKDALPRAGARWSLTALETDPFRDSGGIIGRGDRLRYNADRSLDVYLQHGPPPGAQRANWLRAPEGAFNLVAHVRSSARHGTRSAWTAPTVNRID